MYSCEPCFNPKFSAQGLCRDETMASSAELVEFLEVPIQAALEGDIATTEKQERGSSSSRTDVSQASTTLTGMCTEMFFVFCKDVVNMYHDICGFFVENLWTCVIDVMSFFGTLVPKTDGFAHHYDWFFCWWVFCFWPRLVEGCICGLCHALETYARHYRHVSTFVMHTTLMPCSGSQVACAWRHGSKKPKLNGVTVRVWYSKSDCESVVFFYFLNHTWISWPDFWRLRFISFLVVYFYCRCLAAGACS